MKYAWSILEVYLKYIWSMLQVSFRHISNILWKLHFQYILSIFKVYSTLVRVTGLDILRARWRACMQRARKEVLACTKLCGRKSIKTSLKLVSAIFYQIFISHQIIALQKLWKTIFISSKKFFLFLKYLNFCISVFPSFSPCQPLL